MASVCFRVRIWGRYLRKLLHFNDLLFPTTLWWDFVSSWNEEAGTLKTCHLVSDFDTGVGPNSFIFARFPDFGPSSVNFGSRLAGILFVNQMAERSAAVFVVRLGLLLVSHP